MLFVKKCYMKFVDTVIFLKIFFRLNLLLWFNYAILIKTLYHIYERFFENML